MIWEKIWVWLYKFSTKGRTIRYLRGGGGGWANTKKKFAHRKNPEKNIVHNKPIEKKSSKNLGFITEILEIIMQLF